MVLTPRRAVRPLLDLDLLDDDTRRNLALLLRAVAQNRADDVADLILGLSLTTISSNQAAFVHDLRRKLPRYHWRPLSGIATGDALADLQRLAVRHGIRLPTSFALVGKTLAQADSIARTLDPELDPVRLLESESLEVLMVEAERRLAPRQLLGTAYTQLEPLTKLPRSVAMLLSRLEEGSLKVGIAPTDLHDVERVLRSVANRLGAALVVTGLLVSSALMARVNDGVALAGFIVSAVLALYLMWKILRTPGDV